MSRVSKGEIQRAKDYAKEYGVRRIYFANLGKDGAYGYASVNTGTITLSKETLKDKNEFWAAVFHEVGHFYCYHNNLYRAYHHFPEYKRMTEKQKRAVVLTGWKAERFVDKWAEKQLKKYYPNLKYRGYDEADDKEWLYEQYLNQFR